MAPAFISSTYSFLRILLALFNLSEKIVGTITLCRNTYSILLDEQFFFLSDRKKVLKQFASLRIFFLVPVSKHRGKFEGF